MTTTTRDFDDYREVLKGLFVPLEVNSDRTDRFHGAMRYRALAEIHVSDVAASQHTVERTQRLITEEERPFFKLSYQISGTGMLIQDNRETMLRPGDLAIYDTSIPYTLAFESDFRFVVFMFPQRLIDLPADLVRQLTARRIESTIGSAGLIAPYLRQLGGHLDQLSGPAGTRLLYSALDLVTTMLADELDVSRAGSARDALMMKLRGYIDENLRSPHLSPAQVAGANFISVSHLHGLFREQGTTVSSWIRNRRLEHCRRDLTDPLYADRSIALVAAAWGFVDAPHFSRVFKATYGVSPTELRALALRATA